MSFPLAVPAVIAADEPTLEASKYFYKVVLDLTHLLQIAIAGAILWMLWKRREKILDYFKNALGEVAGSFLGFFVHFLMLAVGVIALNGVVRGSVQTINKNDTFLDWLVHPLTLVQGLVAPAALWVEGFLGATHMDAASGWTNTPFWLILVIVGLTFWMSSRDGEGPSESGSKTRSTAKKSTKS